MGGIGTPLIILVLNARRFAIWMTKKLKCSFGPLGKNKLHFNCVVLFLNNRVNLKYN